jgi:hypothetical protein
MFYREGSKATKSANSTEPDFSKVPSLIWNRQIPGLVQHQVFPQIPSGWTARNIRGKNLGNPFEFNPFGGENGCLYHTADPRADERIEYA